MCDQQLLHTHSPSHPGGGTSFTLLARENRYPITSPAKITNTLVMYLPSTLLSSFSCRCGVIQSGLCHFSDIICTKPTFSPGHQSLSVKLCHIMSMHFPTTICSKFKQATPSAQCQIDEWDFLIVLWLPLEKP